MSLSLAARSLRSRSVNGCARGLRRYSSAVGTGLPLEGIRVLDMTRVLAGVSLFVLVTVLIEKY
jgi:succinate--hydroxymethylglutarate CoA-transferase